MENNGEGGRNLGEITEGTRTDAIFVALSSLLSQINHFISVDASGHRQTTAAPKAVTDAHIRAV